MKKIFAFVLTFIFVLSSCSSGEKVGTDYDFKPVVEKCAEALMENNPSPSCGSPCGEWVVFDVILSKAEANEELYDTYYQNLCDYITEREGIISSTKSTDYSRVMLALSAMGKNVSDVAGYDLLEHYTDIDVVTKQGLPGAIYALIALDSMDYEIYESANFTRKDLVDYIMEKECPNGGWAIVGNSADIDITAEAIQSLAPYMEDEEIKNAVERALNLLSEMQNEDGGFSAWGGENSQSVAEVLIALTSAGIDPRTDERFIKKNGWIGSFIMKYYLGDGTFCHTLKMGYDEQATENCVKALIALYRFDSGLGGVYDFC